MVALLVWEAGTFPRRTHPDAFHYDLNIRHLYTLLKNLYKNNAGVIYQLKYPSCKHLQILLMYTHGFDTEMNSDIKITGFINKWSKYILDGVAALLYKTAALTPAEKPLHV